MSKKTEKTENFDFEKSLEHLGLLVKKMESGNLPLEESLKYFEEGVALVRQCQNALTQVEQKIQILTKQNDNEILSSFSESHES